MAMNRWVGALRLTSVGFYIAGCIILGVVLGVWLDSKVDTSPLFMLLGLGFGLFAAFYGTYRMLLWVLGEGHGKREGDS